MFTLADFTGTGGKALSMCPYCA